MHEWQYKNRKYFQIVRLDNDHRANQSQGYMPSRVTQGNLNESISIKQ